MRKKNPANHRRRLGKNSRATAARNEGDSPARVRSWHGMEWKHDTPVHLNIIVNRSSQRGAHVSFRCQDDDRNTNKTKNDDESNNHHAHVIASIKGPNSFIQSFASRARIGTHAHLRRNPWRHPAPRWLPSPSPATCACKRRLIRPFRPP